ncbi:MAG: hypothetical protein QOF27_3049 [Gaiellaceae bacterium]|nr:hypothetical protein [Gaiellaceae bacterium]
MNASGAIRSARHLGSFPRPRTDAWVMIGQDGGQSIDLGEETLVVFADTLLMPTGVSGTPEHRAALPQHAADYGDRSVFLANCAALMDERDLRSGLRRLRFFSSADGFPVEILATTEAEQAARLRLWPAHGIRSGANVYLYYLGIETIAPDLWGFRNVGVGLARLDPETGSCERIRVDGDWCLWPPRSDDFHFGVQVLQQDGYAYVFGSTRDGLDVTSLVGRVPFEEIADRGAYEFYNPSAECWLSDPHRAGSLGPCGSDYSVSFNPYLGKYLMIYVDAFSKELAIRLADRLEGPYSPPETVGRLPHSPASTLIYLGFEHPKFARDDGRRVFVSYCEPRFEMSSLLEVSFR